MEEGNVVLWEGELSLQVILPEGVEKASSGERRHASARCAEARDRWNCGRVISCSRDQEWWRTELELRRGESFDDGHGSAAVGAAPQRVHCRSGRRLRFVFWWSGMESGEAPW